MALDPSSYNCWLLLVVVVLLFRLPKMAPNTPPDDCTVAPSFFVLLRDTFSFPLNEFASDLLLCSSGVIGGGDSTSNI